VKLFRSFIKVNKKRQSQKRHNTERLEAWKKGSKGTDFALAKKGQFKRFGRGKSMGDEKSRKKSQKNLFWPRKTKAKNEGRRRRGGV